MKKLLLLITITVLSFTSSYASHLMGAEITYTYVSGNDYEVTLIIYRDCNGINLSTISATTTFQSASCGQNFGVALPYLQTNDVSQVCPGQATTCTGGTVPGTQQFVYRGIVTLTPCTDWIMRWNSGTRNPAITNLVSPSSQNLYIQNTLNNVVGSFNNSPQFFNIPTPYLCANQLAIYSHAASDADGDSLYYSFNTPLTTPGPPGAPIAFSAGYSLLQPMITSAGMNLDQQTGEMCFTPSQVQVSVVSVLIEEFRNGTLIGTQIREMQVIVSGTCTNQNPSAGVAATCGGAGGMIITIAGPSVDSVDQNSIRMCPGDNVCLEITFVDPDPLDNITVADNIAAAIPGATWTVVGNGTPTPVGTFCWIPTALDSGINVFSIILTDDACPISGTQTFTYDITVFDQPYAGPDDTICETQPTQLNATGGATYTWFDPVTNIQIPVGADFSCNPCFNPIVTPLVTTSYYVVSSLAATCANTDTVEIIVIPGYTLSSTQSDTNICVGDVINFATTTSIAGAYTYSWTSTTGVLGTPTMANTSGTFNTPGIDTVLVTVDNVSCALIDTFFVNVAAVPNINITTPDTLLDCVSNLTINVGLGGAPTPNNYAFDWNFGTTLNNATIQNPTATPTQAITNYIVIVTDTLGNCFDTDTVEISSCCIVPIVNFTNSTCFGVDDAKIVASATDPFNNLTIEFHMNDLGFTLLQSSTGLNQADSITNLAPGSYIIMITTPVGCSFSDTITITEPAPVTLTDVTPDTIICINGTATLYGTANGINAPILIWDNGLIGSGSHDVNPTADSTTYTVYAQDTNYCVSDTQSVIVALFPPIVISSIELFRNTICKGDTTTIRVAATGGGTDLFYTWLNGSGGIVGVTDTNQFIITPSFDGEVFSVIVSDSCTTPTQTLSITTDWSDIVLPTYTVTDIAGCYDQILPTITNTTLNLGSMASVLWDFGDGETDDFPFGTPIIHAYQNPGFYDITLTITDQAGCVWDTIMDGIQIDAHDYPTVDFLWNPNPTDYLNAQITFDNQSTGNVFNEWLFITDAQYTSNDIDPVFQFPQTQPGNYSVTLKVTNKFGCQDSITKKVIIDDVFLFYIPTGFTPDGNGLNDEFKVISEGVDLSSFKMTIFNKWGELIFESNDPNIGWDGTRGGSLVPDGVYVWIIEAKEAHSSIIHNKNGFVTIMK